MRSRNICRDQQYSALSDYEIPHLRIINFPKFYADVKIDNLSRPGKPGKLSQVHSTTRAFWPNGATVNPPQDTRLPNGTTPPAANGTPPTVKYVYTTGEAAEICKVSQQTVIRCFDAGR